MRVAAPRRRAHVGPRVAVAIFILATSYPALGMEWREAGFGAPDGTTVRYVVVTAPIPTVAVRVMVPSLGYAPLQGSQTAQKQYGSSSVTAPWTSLEAATSTPYVASLPPGSVAVISGGFGSTDPSRPAALVIANGEVVKQLNLSRATPIRTVTPGAQCPNPKRYKWSGLLCATGGKVRIESTDKLEPNGFAEVEQCRDALQSFPLVVEPGGTNGICSDEPTRASSSGKAPKPEARAVICTTPDEIKLIVTEPTHLYPLAQQLLTVERCDAALNLSGSAQAGIGYRSSTQARWIWWRRWRNHG